MPVSEPSYEYRVFAGYRNGTGRGDTVIDRPENPFHDREQAEAFAASFTPPKFTRSWVERRKVGPWRRINAR